MDGERRPEAPVRAGQGVSLCGQARFVTRFRIPEEWHRRPLELLAQGVGDGYRVSVDGVRIAEAGRLDAAWESCRFELQRFHVCLAAGIHELELEIRDWCGGGVLSGAVWLTRNADSPFY